MEVILDNENFEKEVLKADIPVLVDFWASWCGPCKMIAPIISEIANDYKDVLKVGKVNVDEQNELAGKYQILSIPTLLIFKNGQIMNTIVGYHSKEELKNQIDSVIK